MKVPHLAAIREAQLGAAPARVMRETNCGVIALQHAAIGHGSR